MLICLKSFKKLVLLIHKTQQKKLFIWKVFNRFDLRYQSSFVGLMAESALNKIDETKVYPTYDYPLKFEIIKKCSVSKARCSRLELPHAKLQTPQFMPVGTQGALKGILPQQIKDLNCNLILANTYHLGHRPVGKLWNKIK